MDRQTDLVTDRHRHTDRKTIQTDRQMFRRIVIDERQKLNIKSNFVCLDRTDTKIISSCPIYIYQTEQHARPNLILVTHIQRVDQNWC